MPTDREAPEGTRILVGGLEKLMDIWGKISSVNGVLDDFSRGRPEQFISLYLSPTTWWLEREDGNGILYLTLIQPRLSAHAHILYWDKKLRGREQDTLTALRFAVNKFDLKKVNITLPDFAHAAIAFVDRLGFKREGELRNWSYCNGKLYGVYWYGMTREEALDGAGHIPESDVGERSEAVSRDGGPAEVLPGTGSSSDSSPADPIRPSGSERDAGEHQPEHAADSGLSEQVPPDGEH